MYSVTRNRRKSQYTGIKYYDTFTDANTTLLINHQPEVGEKWTGTTNSTNYPGGVMDIFNNKMRMRTTLGLAVTATNQMPLYRCTSFDISYQSSWGATNYGSHWVRVGGAYIGFAANQTSKIWTYTPDGGGLNVSAATHTTLTLYPFRMTWDGTNFRFYFATSGDPTLVSTRASGIDYNNFGWHWSLASTGANYTYYEDVNFYINQPNPYYGSY